MWMWVETFVTADSSFSLTPHTDLLLTPGQLWMLLLFLLLLQNLKTFTQTVLNSSEISGKSSVDPVTGGQSVRYRDQNNLLNVFVYASVKYNHIIFNPPLTWKKSFGHFESSNVLLLCRSSASWARRQIPPDAAALWLDAAAVNSASLMFPSDAEDGAEDYRWSGSSGVRRGCPPVSQQRRGESERISCWMLGWKRRTAASLTAKCQILSDVIASWLRITEKIGWWHFSWHEARREMKHMNVQHENAPCSIPIWDMRDSGNLITSYSKTCNIQDWCDECEHNQPQRASTSPVVRLAIVPQTQDI